MAAHSEGAHMDDGALILQPPAGVWRGMRRQGANGIARMALRACLPARHFAPGKTADDPDQPDRKSRCATAGGGDDREIADVVDGAGDHVPYVGMAGPGRKPDGSGWMKPRPIAGVFCRLPAACADDDALRAPLHAAGDGRTASDGAAGAAPQVPADDRSRQLSRNRFCSMPAALKT